MTKPKKKNRFIYLYILIVLVLCFVIYLLPKLSDTMTKTVIAEYGTMELSDEVQCYAARNEKVYTAGSGGQTEYLVNEGEKVRKGTKVLKVSGGGAGQPGDKYTSILERLGSGARQSDSYTTATNGVISYYIDGYESTFTHKKIKKMTFDQVKDIQNDYMDLSRKSVLAGEPVYKLYKNEKWYMVFWIDEESASDYEKGRSVTVRLKDGEVEADIESVTAGEQIQSDTCKQQVLQITCKFQNRDRNGHNSHMLRTGSAEFLHYRGRRTAGSLCQKHCRGICIQAGADTSARQKRIGSDGRTVLR